MINPKISELIDKYVPDIYKKLLNENGDNKIAAFECDRENELRLMKVHHENSKRSGLNVIGIDDLIMSLHKLQEDTVFLINIRNRKYFLKLYLDKKLNHFLGYILIELRKKTEEEIRWGRDVLGIKTLPPDM
ncbi:hypothetical protein [Brenneria tiliae]|uniref:Uncharacterized protein n=1 Tax=Brenneria tiliae TaxID=2914984 RepID=A0ABT0MXD7_9GAMM|nr:hypothetical protein [Brenneria tiliae]MCL2894509.1 hypothetical protein [Brenneria tiliae]